MRVCFNDFAELYRAAFAEDDPNRKSLLLQEVQRVLEEWERRNDDATVAERAQKLA